MRHRSRELDLKRYGTDKVPAGYLSYYDRVLGELADEPITMLELGVFRGESLRLWSDYFPKAQIVGLDQSTVKLAPDLDRVSFHRGSQQDTEFLTRVAQEHAPDGFDLIIDDASHLAEPTRVGFWHLFENHLRPGGIFAIEDWGTGYWSHWPDGERYHQGQPHHAGMVGFVKELVDEQAAQDASRDRWDQTPTRVPRFESMLIMPAIVFVTKLRV